MSILKSKRADGGVIAILLVVIVLIFVGWLVNVGNRECRTNKDCGNDAYCGSDFACHQIPVIERSTSTSYTLPALIIGAAMIITAVILRWDKLRSKKPDVEAPADMEEPASALKSP